VVIIGLEQKITVLSHLLPPMNLSATFPIVPAGGAFSNNSPAFFPHPPLFENNKTLSNNNRALLKRNNGQWQNNASILKR
jgi:hypothetical protein